MKKALNVICKSLMAIATVSASFAVNSACITILYEPETPEAAKALVK